MKKGKIKKMSLREHDAMLLYSLEHIWALALDYDGETTVKGLKGLIDEIKSEASDAMHNKRDLSKVFSGHAGKPGPKFRSWVQLVKMLRLGPLLGDQNGK